MNLRNPIVLGFAVFILFYNQSLLAQDSLKTELNIEEKIELLSEKIPPLNSKVDISVSDITIQEFFRAMAKNVGLNIDVDPSLDYIVVNNFSNARVADVLIYLHQQFGVEYEFVGNIITVKPKKRKPEKAKELVSYANERFSCDFNGESLDTIARTIIRKTNTNIIFPAHERNTKIYGFIRDVELENGLRKLAYSNGLVIEKTRDGFFKLEKIQDKENAGSDKLNNQTNTRSSANRLRDLKKTKIQLDIHNKDSISIYAIDIPKLDLIEIVSNELEISYFLNSKIQDNISLNVKHISYDNFLEYLFNGTDNVFKKQNSIYLIGDASVEELSDYKIVQLQHRTVDSLEQTFPEKLKESLEIIEFTEMNSLFISGAPYKIAKLEHFIKQIDKPVPVILIEVIIVDLNKSHIVASGIQAGKGDAPTTSQQIYPSVDYTLSSEGINNIINSFDGFGWINLGNVESDFFITLKAMEDEGILDVRSTPKLSTLNGHGAEMSIGNKEYYVEKMSNLMGTQNPLQTNTETYKPVDAELKIDIRPVVSGDNQITLEIDVQQSDFTERIKAEAPPGQVTRHFKSTIRIKNQEMILLGGLEEKRVSDSGKGFPILSRIPILKWIFSSREKEDSNSKLNIFIKPTIVS